MTLFLYMHAAVLQSVFSLGKGIETSRSQCAWCVHNYFTDRNLLFVFYIGSFAMKCSNEVSKLFIICCVLDMIVLSQLL